MGEGAARRKHGTWVAIVTAEGSEGHTGLSDAMLCEQV